MTSRKTDERLKSWLDTNQLERERLCIAVLALDRRFVDVTPRQPRGGPDGGRDIQAKQLDGTTVFGAVGFQNQVSDTPTQKSKATRKFKSDLQVALLQKPDLKTFVFFTNVNFSVTEKEELDRHAAGKGIERCLVFDREYLIRCLNGPDGLGIRYQYLAIPLSKAEQASFFGKWGSDIQCLVSQSFQNVERRLQRLEYNQELSKRLVKFGVFVQLDCEISSATLPKFRFLLRIELPLCHTKRPFHFALTAGDQKPNSSLAFADAIIGALWGNDPKQPYMTTRIPRPQKQSDLRASYSLHGEDTGVFPRTLGDLEENWVSVRTTKSLAERISRIDIHGNGQLIWHCEKSDFVLHEPIFPFFWLWETTSEELEDEWVELGFRMPIIRFDKYPRESVEAE